MKRPPLVNPWASLLLVAWGAALVLISPWMLLLLPVVALAQGWALENERVRAIKGRRR